MEVMRRVSGGCFLSRQTETMRVDSIQRSGTDIESPDTIRGYAELTLDEVSEPGW